MILGGDLNFSLGVTKPWGPHARIDSLVDFFSHKISTKILIDLDGFG